MVIGIGGSIQFGVGRILSACGRVPGRFPVWMPAPTSLNTRWAKLL